MPGLVGRLLRRRLGRVRTAEVLNTLFRVAFASAAGAAIALLLGALREVLRQAVLLQDQVVGVTHAQENPPR